MTTYYDYTDIQTGEGVSDNELHQRYDEMLDECYGIIEIGELEYSTSRAMKEIDPIAYRCGFNDWVDSEIGESIEEVSA